MELSDLVDYQLRCYKKVLHYIECGEKHISILMSPGSGKKTISYLLCREFSHYKKVLYIAEPKQIVLATKQVITEMKLEVDVCSVVELENVDVSKYDYIFLMNLRVLSRKLVTEMCKSYCGVTISFGTPYQEIKGENVNNRLLAYASYLSKAAFVYTTKTVVDIRDSVDAEEEEKDYVREQLKKQKNEYDEQEKQSLFKIETVSTEKSALDARISAYAKRLLEMTEAKKKANELEKVKAELEKIKREAKKKEEEIERLKEENRKIKSYSDLQEQLLIGVGISSEVVKEMYDKIEKARLQLEDRINSDDEEIQEKAMHSFQNIVTNLVYEETKDFVKISSGRYEDIMVDALTDKVWKLQLSDKSRSFLITAKANFDSLSRNTSIYDYSGVCLLVTKALEVETTKRFYHEYLTYLQSEESDVSRWPESVRQRRGYQILDEAIEEEQFMLGSVVSFMGIKRVTDRNGNITGYRIRSQADHDKFVNFAMDRLFDGLSRNSVEQKLEQDYLFIEKVRVDYRNPAAHKNALTSVSAEECIKYVIEAQKMLRKMLIDMKI